MGCFSKKGAQQNKRLKAINSHKNHALAKHNIAEENILPHYISDLLAIPHQLMKNYYPK